MSTSGFSLHICTTAGNHGHGTIVAPDVIVRFAGIPGRTYRIETTADLTPPITWTPHPAGPLVAGSNGVLQLTDPAPPAPRFYRAAEF